MTRFPASRRFLPTFAASLLALLSSAPALRAADDGRYAMEVLVDGVPLTEYAARGTTYIEALRGREYSVRLSNRTGERVAVALSVDGLNSIDAKTTTMAKASKWILDPWQTLEIDGWQTSDSTARRFYFTSEERSYGAWLGKTKNLGIVSAAFFREDRPVPPPRYERFRESDGQLRQNESGRDSSAGVPAPSAEAAPRSERRQKSDLSDDYAATGIGRELDHDVVRVEFRAERHPVTVFALRYEYRDALVRLGVLRAPRPRYPDPLDRREHSGGFRDGGFAPDPWRGGSH